MASSLILPNTPPTNGVTFNGQEAREFLLEPAFRKPEITAFHTVDENIKTVKQIAYLSRLGKTGLLDTGCGEPTNQGSFKGSEKFWNPKDVIVNLVQCESDIRGSLLRYAAANGIDRTDLSKNDVWFGFMQESLIDNLIENALRRAWLSDTAYVAGSLTTAGDLAYYNLYDGFFKQITASVTAGGANAARRSYTISENAAATKAAQLDLAADRGYSTLKNIVNGADARLASSGDAVIVMSRSLAQNYADYLQEKGVDPSFVRIEGGYTSLQYQGKPIYVFDLWDRYVQADFDNGTVYTVPPHMAVMTTAENLRFGIDALDSMTDIEFFYDQRTRDNITRAMSVEDTKIVWDFMVSAAY